jgi:hypothetical protein
MYNVEAHYSFSGLRLKLKKINGLQSNFINEHQRAEFQQDFHHQQTEQGKCQRVK